MGKFDFSVALYFNLPEMEKFKIQTKNFSNEVFVRSSNEAVIFREHSISDERIMVDVQPMFWTLAWAQIPKDHVYFYSNKKWHEVSGSVVIYKSPFSVIRWRLKPGTLRWGYLVSKQNIDEAVRIPSQIVSPVVMMESGPAMLNFIRAERGVVLDIDPKKDCVCDLKAMIDTTFQSSENIKDLLSVNRNYAYMSREFKKKYALSPVKYRNQLRLMQVAQDLIFSGNAVESVYHQNGIQDAKYFYSRFKLLFGAFPAQFRRHMTEDSHS
ncbi:MAG: helix-turn-helix domain-containing protein [Bdellovibrionaceae bacterium]|nr:helix-turn-helix domain-containing protein [Pseudobdellovibrionaceae bacterium]